MTTPDLLPGDEWMRSLTPRPCRADPDLWFSNTAADRKAAIQACNTCPLLQPCAEYALAHRPEYGVWGGLTRKARSGQASPPRPRRKVTDPVDCSNPTAYFQHRRRGEICDVCFPRRADQLTRERRARLDAEHAAHGGSMVGYHTHKALGEDPCDACRDVNRARCEANRAATRRRPRAASRQTDAA
ncbi:WhiB family transcriptional regulator [Streptomyces sp. NPDC060020]|uniref:WhiB family transcriptional regulator n=1 Tax=Streptomyces sp. NPDC060020 TaxID=3347038 RepID=UPI0036C14BB0